MTLTLLLTALLAAQPTPTTPSAKKVAGPIAAAPDPAAKGNEVTFDHLLVLPAAGGGGRAPFRADPLLNTMMFANWHEPKAGDKVGEREWKEISREKNDKGEVGEGFQDRALAGGYALASFESPRDGVMILEAAGHVSVYVNPTPTTFELHTGDPYENGAVRVPVKVKQGHNYLLFAAGRGHLRLKLTEPPASVFISPADATMPDLIEESATTTLNPPDLLGAVVVVNASEQWQRGLMILCYAPHSSANDKPATPRVCGTLPPIPPLSARKVPVALPAQTTLAAGEATFAFAIPGGPAEPARVPFKVRVRKPEQTRKVTFKSEMDGSVQYYGFNPAAPAPDSSEKGPARPGLILSLHGASVEAAHQAECYSPKAWAALAAPTNRREYGFDWEDWGRLDALEVLAHATALAHPDPSRIWLTGHSMGGHGTWIIGSTYPDRFAAIAPSAGWSTFWSYGGAAVSADSSAKDKAPDLNTPEGRAANVLKVFQRAMNPGDTIALASNLGYMGQGKGPGVYILHGDKDDNVPVEQARTMKALLEKLGIKDVAYHEQPGAGHWWGNECMDWPPLMDFLKAHTIPADKNVTHIHFSTANPAVSASCHWATIVQQEQCGKLSTIDLSLEGVATRPTPLLRGTTDNVAMLAIDLSRFGTQNPTRIELDGTVLDNFTPPKQGPLYLVRGPSVQSSVQALNPDQSGTRDGHSGDKWYVSHAPSPAEKSPAASGPFKHAFNNRSILVYGTHGSPEENAWMLAKARFDAETIWYRGNGCFDVMSDDDFTAAAADPTPTGPTAGRSVIVYGNSSINAAWAGLLGGGGGEGGSPLEVHKGGIFLGEHEFKDDWYAALFVRPRREGGERGTGNGERGNGPEASSAFRVPRSALVGAVAFTGLRGARALERLPYFSSGVQYPDWTIFSSRVLTAGLEGVEGAGYFNNSWELDEGQSAWLVP